MSTQRPDETPHAGVHTTSTAARRIRPIRLSLTWFSIACQISSRTLALANTARTSRRTVGSSAADAMAAA
ncbi:hypothetical protein ACX27O_19155 [Micromonospora sp. SD19]